MTTIVVTHEDNEVDEFAFDSVDQVISIGRRMSNDVCIPNLSVSGMHARLTIDGDSALIEDNNSTNGTYVNGRLISRQLLNNDDEIVIGKARLTVQLDIAEDTGDEYVTDLRDQSAEHFAADQHGIDQGQDQHHPAANDFSTDEPPVLNATSAGRNTSANITASASSTDFLDDSFDDASKLEMAADLNMDDADDSYVGTPGRMASESLLNGDDDAFDEHPMSLSDKAKLALGRERDNGRNGVRKVVAATAATSAVAAASRAFASNEHDTAVAEPPTKVQAASEAIEEAHPLDGLDNAIASDVAAPVKQPQKTEQSTNTSRPVGAVIEIQNGAKSGQVLPIDKPVTTLGRPGIQIAAIMRKPDGYFLMHIESDDSIDMPTLNRDTIGDEPVLLHSGDRLNVAGIDVEFMLS